MNTIFGFRPKRQPLVVCDCKPVLCRHPDRRLVAEFHSGAAGHAQEDGAIADGVDGSCSNRRRNAPYCR